MKRIQPETIKIIDDDVLVEIKLQDLIRIPQQNEDCKSFEVVCLEVVTVK